MINYYERCNADDDTDSAPVNQQDDQAFFPAQKTPQIGWPPNSLDNENIKNGNHSPTSPGAYYSTITSVASRSRNLRPGTIRKSHRRAVFKNGKVFDESVSIDSLC